jgi:hypothetical protein
MQPPLYYWQNFWVILGSAAGALTGLQFIVLTLIRSIPGISRDPTAGSVFSTPAVLYFCTVLGFSGVFAIPWPSPFTPLLLAGLAGVAGFVYTATLSVRLQRQPSYQPVWEDWVFRLLLPLALYAALASSAFLRHTHTTGALQTVALSSLGLLFTGIHHAWDNVLYLVFLGHNGEGGSKTPE